MRWLRPLALPLLLALPLVAAGAVSAFATEPGDLRARVREELLHLPYIESSWVRVRGSGRTIALTGRVPGELEARIVVETARNVPGVAVVKDDLALDASLERWKPTAVESARQRLTNARRALRADAELGVYTTLHVSRQPGGVVVTGDVGSRGERARLARLLAVIPPDRVAVRVRVRPDASRRAAAKAASDEGTVAFVASVAAALEREPLLRGRLRVHASVERDALVLRGEADSLLAHDLALALARSALRARAREAESVAARSGDLARLLGGTPAPLEGAVPARVESLVLVRSE